MPMLSKDKNLTIFFLSIFCFLIHLCSKNTGINELELFLSVQFSSIKYIHGGVQPSRLSTSRTFSSSHTETLYPLVTPGLPWWFSG